MSSSSSRWRIWCRLHETQLYTVWPTRTQYIGYKKKRKSDMMSGCLGNIIPAAVLPGDEVRDMEPFPSTSSPLELSGEETQRVDGSWSRDGDLRGCGQLERRWVLWHEFMKEHAHLDTWLRSAEQAVSSPDSAHLTYTAAKEELRKFELAVPLPASCLLTLCLLQSFQQCVLVNSGRVNALLRRGEALIQRSEPTDGQRVESRLLELLRRCGHVYGSIARTHTRLLSMRLVFEDDWILSEATDSGCPSETLLEEEGALDKPDLDLPAVSNQTKANPTSAFPSDLPSPIHHPPPPPPSPSSPTHEHLGLEWDPSVDIGRSVSCDDSDSSYFTASTGLCHRDGLKRWSYLSSLSSQSDFGNGITNQEADLRLGWLDHTHPGVFSPVAPQEWEPRLNGDQWATSTPDRKDSEPISFDGGRVTAWLGGQSRAPPEGTTSCSKAVQTDGEAKEEPSCREEAEHLLPERSVASSSRASSSSSLLSPALLFVLLAAALALLACLLWVLLESPCHRSSRMPHNLHLTLRYVNGPPPT
ncbi:uncharacterized protein si:ch211-137a8.2 [Xiphias gladius]|uniref:uncharacterized protein si:ch211-137a8.2 n=1 Tax=Xiphias gladius TaxID=8245 RepID=UPI001A98D733|nr:uncharacterized protein si:ch211-137a8.2 [Xiphias gladius]